MTLTATLTVTDPTDDDMRYQAVLVDGRWHVMHGLKLAGIVVPGTTFHRTYVGGRFGAPADQCTERASYDEDLLAAIVSLHRYWDVMSKLDADAEAAFDTEGAA
jgi:hypothetical protein